VSGTVLTAAQWNASVRDNLAETSAAVVTTAGDTTYANAANSMARLAKGNTGNVYRQSSGNAPEWFSLHPVFNGNRSATGSVSSAGTQKVTCTLTIPTSWSTGWTLMAWGAGRFIWNGAGTTGDAELYVAGSGMNPSTEQDVQEATVTGELVTTAFSVVGCDPGRTDVGATVVGLFLVSDAAADYADAWVTAVGFYEQ
jgi:hypothetical protein